MSTRLADSEARTNLTACRSSAAEEEFELPGGALGGVGAVYEVIWHAQGEVAADRSGGGIGRVGGAHEFPHDAYGALPPYPHRDDGGRRDELHQLLEEGFVPVLGVVLLGDRKSVV